MIENRKQVNDDGKAEKRFYESLDEASCFLFEQDAVGKLENDSNFETVDCFQANKLFLN